MKYVILNNSDLSKGMNLSSRLSIDSGYKFIGWQSAGISAGWVTSFPIYLSAPEETKGSPYWSGTLPSSGKVWFYYFEIKSYLYIFL